MPGSQARGRGRRAEWTRALRAAVMSLSVWFLTIGPARSASEIVIVVAPSGMAVPATSNPKPRGSRQGPGATGLATHGRETAVSLQDALDRVRVLRREAGAGRAIRVELAPGEHRLEHPVTIGPEHGDRHGAPLIIGGAEGRNGVSGVVRLMGSRRVEPLPDRAGAAPDVLQRRDLSPQARMFVRRYALPPAASTAASIDTPRPQEGVPSVPFEVFDALGPLRPARWPNAGWSAVAATFGRDVAPAFTLSADRIQAWRAEPDLWAGGYWQYDWRYETQRITAVDLTSGWLTLAGRPFDGIRAGARVFVYHALAELDEPGEWYRDAGTRELLAWPRDPQSPSLEISVAEHALRVIGAEHVRIRGLSIERTRGDAIVVKGSSDIVVEDCMVRWTGGRAAVFEDVEASGMSRSHVTSTGAGGVLLYGGERAQLRPAGLFVLDTVFERFARLSLTYAAAVELGGVGHTVSGNVIADADHLGILFQGNDHLIERNELSRLMLDSSDGGAIYTGRDWTARGTRIRHNFLHDIRPAAGFETKGIYLDDMASGIEISGNVFLRVDQAVFIGGGRDNRVTGNVFVATRPAIHLDSRGRNDQKSHIENAASELHTRLRAMPYEFALWRSRYPQLAGILDDDPGAAKRNEFINNIYLTDVVADVLSEVDRGQQIFEPNLSLIQLGRDLYERAAVARGARDLARILETSRVPLHVSAIPFGSMDRRQQPPGFWKR